jgi:hypothetical protein
MHWHFFLAFSSVLLVGCGQSKDRNANRCVQDQILNSSSQLEMQKASVDSIQFSDGAFRYLFKGDFNVDDKKHSFSIMMINNPFNAGLDDVLSYNFPLEEYDTSQFSCCVYCAENDLIAEWKSPGKRLRLFVDRKLISGH